VNWPTAFVICFCAICTTICVIAVTQKHTTTTKRDDDINN